MVSLEWLQSSRLSDSNNSAGIAPKQQQPRWSSHGASKRATPRMPLGISFGSLILVGFLSLHFFEKKMMKKKISSKTLRKTVQAWCPQGVAFGTGVFFPKHYLAQGCGQDFWMPHLDPNRTARSAGPKRSPKRYFFCVFCEKSKNVAKNSAGVVSTGSGVWNCRRSFFQEKQKIIFFWLRNHSFWCGNDFRMKLLNTTKSCT